MSELKSAAGLQAEQLYAAAQTPRLGIQHLMLWTLCSAVFLALTRALNSLDSNFPSGSAATRDVSDVIRGITTGAAFAGSIVLVSIRVRSGPPMLRHPGHWLLFMSAILQLSFLPLNISRLMKLGDFGLVGTSLLLIFYTISAFLPIAYAIAARNSDSRRWKLLFFTLAAVPVAKVVFFGGFWLAMRLGYVWFGFPNDFFHWGGVFLAGVVLAVAITDLVAGQQRDWLHWVGITTHVIASSVIVLWLTGPW